MGLGGVRGVFHWNSRCFQINVLPKFDLEFIDDL